ncbi:hypothetical protein GQ600_10620 [Phytophthora cactorum]|nr:hypothetical protein GQ600_10620 [Phytophthora cactorum]
MIYALEAEIQLRVFDDCFTVMEKSKSALSTGVSYCVLNHRIHCYRSFKGLKGEPDVVNSVLPPHLEYQHCRMKMLENNLIRQHRRYCSENPKAEESKITCRRSDNKIENYVCNVCGKTCPIKGSYRSHRVQRPQEEAYDELGASELYKQYRLGALLKNKICFIM